MSGPFLLQNGQLLGQSGSCFFLLSLAKPTGQDPISRTFIF
ncbi:hypothetical protein HMPREF1557_00231 [Streptococcus sobrinus W1703]|uniref:Uncharacterized protein n=1 Tax=Streptococcus sobrinus W1703 TaxID=1227275 RepID=U2JG35_9STRE|nr:hypothetical protein HMPREF1557_00231 [Streptococcus sobrinus W1703]